MRHSGWAVGVAAMWMGSAAGQVYGPVKAAAANVDERFALVRGAAVAGYTGVAAGAAYSDAVGYGFEPDGAGRTAFSVKVPEGNYTVTVTLGDAARSSVTTVEAESARLMLERVVVPAGQVVQRSFTVNVRTPQLPAVPLNAPGRSAVSLNGFDEGNARDWDDRLTLEFVGGSAAVRTVRVQSAPGVPTVFLAGDSTVTDRDRGGDVSWGQVLPVFLKPGVAVADEAQSGETLKSFANALRLDKVLSQMKAGDYLLIQFGHNDEKANWPQTYSAAETTYKAYLRVYVAEARLRGAVPVLVTPMERGDRKTGAVVAGSHGLYPQAMREVALEEHVALIDLTAMSGALYAGAGAEAAKILADGTHSTPYGGVEFAKCVVTAIQADKLGLASFVVDGFKAFDPKHPDRVEEVDADGLFDTGRVKVGAGPL